MERVELPSGIALAFRDLGTGPALLQIHGLGTGHKNYDLLTPLLAERFRVIDIDLRGYGESDDRDSPRTIDSFAEDAAQFIQAIGIGPIAVHGTSMGGCIAMVLAARFPKLVERLVVTCSFARLDRAGNALRSTWRTAGRAGSGALAELTTVQGFSRGFWDRPEANETQRAFVDALSTTTPEEFLRDLSAMDGLDLEDDVRRIVCETLLLGAAEDIITPVQTAASGLGMTDLERLISRSKLSVLADCGHFISLERPTETADAVAAFLAESVVAS